MNVKKEKKIIKLKDSVLKEFLAKQEKEATASLKSISHPAEKKKLIEEKQIKSGSLTTRPKSASSSNLATHGKRDNFLVSSLLAAQNTFPKEKKKIVMSLMEKIVDKFCNCNFENWTMNPKKEDKFFNAQCIFSYDDLLQILNKIIRTFPSTASLVVLFKTKKLKQFTAFSEFLVLKIYPMGFLNWSYYNESKQPKLDVYEEAWTQYDSKDQKFELKPEDNQTKYRVKWTRNPAWESTIVENMRTLIEFNVFMTPQEKKIKSEIKKHFINALLDKAAKCTSLCNLKMASSLSSSLVLLRKLLFFDQSKEPLMYNKENVGQTITKLKSSNKIFKILSELLKSSHPLSAASDIINPLLIPLVDRMTFSYDLKKEFEKPIAVDMEQEKPFFEENAEEVHEDPENIEDYGFLGLDEQSSNNDEPEQEEEEDEEEENNEPEPYVEENDTESENVSLDDLIEELKYEGEEDSESDEEEDDDDDEEENDDRERNRDEIMEDQSNSNDQNEDVDSEEDEEENDALQEFNENAVEIEVDHRHDIGDIMGRNPIFGIDNDAGNEFEMELFDMSNEEMLDHLRGIRRNRLGAHDSNEDDDDEIIDVGEQDFGSFRQLMGLLGRREGNQRRNPFMRNEGHLRRQIRGPGLHYGNHGGRQRRPEGEVRRRGQGLESLFQIINQDQRDNEGSFWAPQIDQDIEPDNRNRNDRRLELLMEQRYNNNPMGREIDRIRAQVDELSELGSRYGMLNQ